jgi:Membrane bound O-acyl transferase family
MGAALKTLLGATLIWVVARTAYPERPLLAGWLGMVGLILVLHFGTFHLLSLARRSHGVDATPVMRSPLLASSLADFWGRRWNTAFHELATRLTFRPLRPSFGVTGATLLVFLASGFIHELCSRPSAQSLDMRPDLTSGYRVVGYHAINIVFVYCPWCMHSRPAGRCGSGRTRRNPL